MQICQWAELFGKRDTMHAEREIFFHIEIFAETNEEELRIRNIAGFKKLLTAHQRHEADVGVFPSFLQAEKLSPELKFLHRTF